MKIYGLCASIAAAGVACWVRGTGSVSAAAATFLMAAGAFLLCLGLVRDLWTKYRFREGTPLRGCRLRAICVESLTGFGAVVLGGVLEFLRWTPLVRIPFGALLILAAVVGAFQYATRAWVLVLEKVTDHRSIIPGSPPHL